MKLNVLAAGAGFADCVAAERLAAAGRYVLLIDKRNHIGGSALNELDRKGVLVHRSRPRIIHTNAATVAGYLFLLTNCLPDRIVTLGALL